MEISEGTYNQLNKLLFNSFDCNAQADNYAYNIDYLGYSNIGEVYHHLFAHLFPQLADEISDLMIQLNARPIRLATLDYTAQYFNIYDIFADSARMAEQYRSNICATIDVAEANGDYEVVIAMEDLLKEFQPYVKQSNLWRQYAEQYQNEPLTFDVHFKSLTTQINK